MYYIFFSSFTYYLFPQNVIFPAAGTLSLLFIVVFISTEYSAWHVVDYQ